MLYKTWDALKVRCSTWILKLIQFGNQPLERDTAPNHPEPKNRSFHLTDATRRSGRAVEGVLPPRVERQRMASRAYCSPGPADRWGDNSVTWFAYLSRHLGDPSAVQQCYRIFNALPWNKFASQMWPPVFSFPKSCIINLPKTLLCRQIY